MHYATFEIFCNYELLISSFLKILFKNTVERCSLQRDMRKVCRQLFPWMKQIRT